MKHFASPQFWEHYHKLPVAIRQLADKNFERLKQAPYHPSLHLKAIGDFWSVRVGARYRALATETEGSLTWFWIGPHAEYDKLVI